jgi:hypothetical protein
MIGNCLNGIVLLTGLIMILRIMWVDLGQLEDDLDLYPAAGHLALSRLAGLHLQVLQGDRTTTITSEE